MSNTNQEQTITLTLRLRELADRVDLNAAQPTDLADVAQALRDLASEVEQEVRAEAKEASSNG